MKHLLFLWACGAALCVSCSDDDDNKDPKEIELAKGMKQEQTVYADGNGENSGIRFTAVADWTATVTEVPVVRSEQAATVDWLTLSAYSGAAGEHTLTMTIADNRTGKARKAEIAIRCGGTKITVTVEQKAEKEDGSVMEAAKPVKKIIYREERNSDKVDSETDHAENFDKTFAYDGQGRVVRIETQTTRYSSTETTVHAFDYGVVGEINITCTYSDQGSYSQRSRAKLDARGNVVSLQEEEDGQFYDYMTFAYTEDGRLKQWKDADYEDGTEGNFFYTDGYLSKYEYFSERYPEENDVYEFPLATTYPNKYPNSGAIDFLGYIMMDDDYDYLFHIGRLGKSGDYLPESFSAGDYAEYASMDPEYYEPNITIPETRTYVEWPENAQAKLTYEFDGDNNLTKIIVTEDFVVMRSEWDVVVGSEYKNPNRPELGYKYEIQNRQTTKVRDDRNVCTYTITY
ncbi:MAG: hypothetical protein K2O69_06025 [Odoribacter sp.]|nr:hypothetical protein [Odoribacter sp.]